MRAADAVDHHGMLFMAITVLIVLSATAGFVAGRVYGLELAARRIIRAYQEL